MNSQPLLIALGFCTAVMLGGWLVQRRMKSPAFADLLWAGCISVVSLYYGVIAGGAMLPRLLVAVMGGVWGFRLFMHLLQRVLAETPASRREAIDSNAADPARLFGGYLLKAFSAVLFSVPLYVAAGNPRDAAGAWTLLAAAIYIIGLSGEAYADMQLGQFHEQPRNRSRACRRGLWRYSRHPNYFFAFVHWCSYAALAVGVPWTWWTLTWLAPLLTAVVSIRCIPLLERQALAARGEDYREYQKSTSAFVPWLPAAWPNDIAAGDSWYTPPPPSRASATPGARGTPLPGARITPSPLGRARPLTGPTTPRPERPLSQRRDAPITPNPPARAETADVDADD